jgi:dCTP deaminase
MILSDRDILKRLNAGDLQIRPLDDPHLQIQPASVDLRLGAEFLSFRRPPRVARFHAHQIDLRNPAQLDQITESSSANQDTPFILHPHQFVLASTIERVCIPNDLVARLEGRSSLGRLGIVVHATAGYIDPGFEGTITLELSNVGVYAMKLYPGMRIAQLSLHQLSSPAERPYGIARGSKYGGQSRPEPSRIALDAPTKGTQGADSGTRTRTPEGN